MFSRSLWLVFLALTLAACARAPAKPSSADTLRDRQLAGGITMEGYRIGVDDVVQVSVWRNPDLSVTVPVRPDGKISVPLVGDVMAGGYTPMEVAAKIKAKLATYIRDPVVTVILTQLRSHEFLARVRVVGAVRTPRSLPYRQGMTVLDAVLEAGGVNDFAAPDRTTVHRKIGNNNEVFKVHLGRLLTKGGQDDNISLRPGDIIAVPERLF